MSSACSSLFPSSYSLSSQVSDNSQPPSKWSLVSACPQAAFRWIPQRRTPFTFSPSSEHFKWRPLSSMETSDVDAWDMASALNRCRISPNYRSHSIISRIPNSDHQSLHFKNYIWLDYETLGCDSLYILRMHMHVLQLILQKSQEVSHISIVTRTAFFTCELAPWHYWLIPVSAVLVVSYFNIPTQWAIAVQLIDQVCQELIHVSTARNTDADPWFLVCASGARHRPKTRYVGALST